MSPSQMPCKPDGGFTLLKKPAGGLIRASPSASVSISFLVSSAGERQL